MRCHGTIHPQEAWLVDPNDEGHVHYTKKALYSTLLAFLRKRLRGDARGDLDSAGGGG